jgi:hypothetical protein
MSHEIMGQRFVSRSRPAWHKLGIVFPEDEVVSASEAVRRVAGDVQVVTVPLSYELEGARHGLKKHVAVVRKPTADKPQPEVFGVAADSWKAESYQDLARALDKLSEKYRVETAGLLKDGALCFLSLRGEDWDVNGDPMQAWFTANFSLKPGIGHRVMSSPVRVVCWNTNNAAKGSATINLSIPHSADSKQQIGIAGDLIVRFAESQKKTKETCEAFAAREVTTEEADAIFEAAFPTPKVPKKVQTIRNIAGGAEGAELFKKALDPDALASLLKAEDDFQALLERRAELRQVARERYAMFDPARLQGTAWAAYNAATEVADWREGPRAEQSSMFGSRAQEKARAFAETLKLVA